MDLDLDVGYRRTRRNLVLISFIQLLIHLGGISLSSDKQFAIFGTQFSIENPSVLSWGLGLAFAYWAWHYYQYLREFADWEKVQADISARMEKYVNSIAKKTVDQDKLKELKKHAAEAEREGKLLCSVTQKPKGGGEVALRYKTTWIPPGTIERKTHDESLGNPIVEARKLLLPRIRAWIWAFFNKPLILEYLFPVLIALVAIVTSGLSWTAENWAAS